ncbi:MAG: hypothetical protein Q8N53_10945 [Longimicrobiales bacterium]|nr:hypothetical protein [Longimicrobiales bacterium]
MTPNKRSRATSLATLTGLSLLALACSTDSIVRVEDPDIINPSNVRSAAGANAVRLGALSRFVGLATGSESLLFLGGLFTDEWLNGDSFIYKQEVDQRVTPKENSGITGAMRTVHQVRLSAQQAVELIDEWNPSAPGWHTGEMYLLQAYALNLMAEAFCDGMIISNVVEGREEYGDPLTAAAVYEQALTLANDGLARVTGPTADDVRVRSALALTKGRILANLNRQAEAATAVAGIATSFQYLVRHTQALTTNQFWSLNLNSGRYSVSDVEGTNGMDFVSAKDPRVPVCEAREAACKAIGVTRTNRDDLTRPLNVLMKYASREDAIPVMQGVDARMIEAEAQLKAGNSAAALATLNAARTTVSGLAPLADAGSASARLDQLFRERAFWQYGRGYRMGDMRRLVRQYGRTETQVFPVGAWHKGGNYGAAVDFPLPQAEENNPNLGVGNNCMSRGA